MRDRRISTSYARGSDDFRLFPGSSRGTEAGRIVAISYENESVAIRLEADTAVGTRVRASPHALRVHGWIGRLHPHALPAKQLMVLGSSLERSS